MAPIADLLADAERYSISPPRRVRQWAATVGSQAAHRFAGLVVGRRGGYRSCRPRSTAGRPAEPQGLAEMGRSRVGAFFFFRGIFLLRRRTRRGRRTRRPYNCKHVFLALPPAPAHAAPRPPL